MILTVLAECWLVGLPIGLVCLFVFKRSRIAIRDFFKDCFLSPPYCRAQNSFDPLSNGAIIIIANICFILFFPTVASLDRLGGIAGIVHVHVVGMLTIIGAIAAVFSIKLRGVWRFHV